MLSRKAWETLAMVSAPERAADGVAAERQRQAGHFLPPLAEVDDALQSGFGVA